MKKKGKSLFAIVFSCGLFAYFLHKLDVQAFLSTLGEISFLWIFIGLFLFLTQIVLKAYRLKYVLHIEDRFIKNTIGINGVYTLLKNILPAGLGEVSIFYLLKKGIKIDYSRSVGAFFLFNTIDFLISALVLLGIFLFKGDSEILLPAISTIIKALLGISAALVMAIYFVIYNRWLFEKMSQLVFINSTKVGRKIFYFLVNMRDYSAVFISFGSVSVLAFFSIILWIVLFFLFVSACGAVHAGLNYWEICVVFIMLWPINALPIKGVLNLGSHQVGWVLPLTLMGYSTTCATLIAFGTHAIALINLAVTALILLVFYHRSLAGWIFGFESRN